MSGVFQKGYVSSCVIMTAWEDAVKHQKLELRLIGMGITSIKMFIEPAKLNCGHCPICNPKIFAQWYPQKKPRRSHEETLLARRKKAQAISYRRELHARLRREKEDRKNAMQKL